MSAFGFFMLCFIVGLILLDVLLRWIDKRLNDRRRDD